jgi:hypothetical protein
MKYFTFLFPAVLIITGCGGGTSSTSSSGESDIIMETDHSYTVKPGDRIVKTSSPTLVEIKHTDGHTDSTVTLIEGEAKIIQKP